MIDFASHRAKLESRLAQIHAKSDQSTLLEDDQPKCDHEWQKFKQTVRTDNPGFHGSAYFIVKACLKCKQRRTLDYVVGA